ncbi:MAG: rRNA maturation RNase YbeY [Solirubrobacterales bacterium]
MSVDIECPDELRPAAEAAAAASGLKEGHLCVELVDTVRITGLNRIHRDKNEPTDVLSFPIDGRERATGPRELGDVMICAERSDDLEQAVVHGVLHLAGFDHERDDGEMLALEQRILARLRSGD